MARKRVDAEPLTSWNDVSSSLAKIGELDRKLSSVENAMQQKIDAAKADAAKAAEPLQKQKAQLEASIAAYADAHRDELGDRKSKTLYFGTVGYRKSRRIILPRGAAKIAEIVIRCRSRKMTDCIVTKPETIDKEALKKYAPSDIEAVGARLNQKDAFWYEVDQERLPDM